MLLHIGFLLVGFVFLATSFLMFAFPKTYVDLVNRYFRLTGFQHALDPRRYQRWVQRVSSFCVFAFILLLIGEYIAILWHHGT
jgi:hypothetical protein